MKTQTRASRKATRHLPGSQPGRRIAAFMTWAYALATLVNVALLITRPSRHGFVEFVFGILNIPAERSLITLVVAAVTFWALLRRKRAGLWAAMFFQLTGVALGALTALTYPASDVPPQIVANNPLLHPVWDYVGGVVGVVFLILLFRARREFPARIRGASYGAAMLVLVAGFLLAVLAAWAFLPFHSWGDLGALLLRATGVTSPAVMSHLPNVHRWHIQAVSTIYGLSAIVAIWVFLRSARPVHSWTGERELHLRELLHEHGHQDSLSYFASRREKSTVFSSDGRAAVTYRVFGSVSLASGDPVGERASWEGAILKWKSEAREYGWIPAVISASRDGARAYTRAGLSVLGMGDEAILYPDRFSLNNTSLTEVRHSVQRLVNEGLSYRIKRQSEFTQDQLDQLVALADEWRHGKVERGFSMALNRLGDPADSRTMFMVAETPEGRPVGLLSFVPWGANGLSLDVMRRSPEAPNGTTEFMIVKMMEEAESLGIARVSLNFAMFRETFARAEELGANPLTRFGSSVLGVLDRFLQLERLYKFNQKFGPTWVPRYICVDSYVSIPNVGVACGIAEGFLPAWLGGKPAREGSLGRNELERLTEIERRRVGADDLTPKWSDQTRHRIKHLEQMREAGYEPYPKGTGEGITVSEFASRLTNAGVQEPSLQAGRTHTDGTTSSPAVSVNGRVRSMRRHGKVTFLDLYEHGTVVQAVLDESVCGPDMRKRVRWIDSGDYVLLRGRTGASRNGTPSLIVETWEVISKCLHPIPFDSFTDPEARLRRRSMDLIVNPEESKRLRIRSTTIRAIRRTLDDQGFLEVETPMLNTIHGGASARPFKTFINAYGVDLTLRIAPELYLKRLVVGDMGPVYELGRDFRNEGADSTHNPEFTVLEAYQPYADYNVMRELTERILKHAAREVFGKESLPLRLGDDPKDPRQSTVLTDVSGAWPVVSVCDALSEAVGQPITLDTDFEILMGLAREHEIHVRDDMGPGAVIEELYGELVEAKTSRPTFYKDFPVETSPLAGPHRADPRLAERWDLVINGTEMGTAYSEMADAIEQRRRLTEQSLKAAAGDMEAMQIDEDFLDALETGLPPTGGLGIGIDRLIMMLTGAPIRGVLAFPFVRPGATPRLKSAPRSVSGPDSASVE
ncbi:bifunctional lysylphosphatidylglycerol synthetase/lysine--tRNA ligase LysX [Rothia uropygioeca]|uniref:bifunctional lysylphosphatidylglycerol synthetase/lysine--tRNA ligase LysX n=1 Tax=Kocuria sp. 257 TaxID=2021970 RepID=UPI001EDD08C3|nr:bifunctional lysylphosphatidylglycerol synthetase/lysine--tRNA ligase LysX [Kocuria sp. 257]